MKFGEKSLKLLNPNQDLQPPNKDTFSMHLYLYSLSHTQLANLGYSLLANYFQAASSID